MAAWIAGVAFWTRSALGVDEPFQPVTPSGKSHSLIILEATIDGVSLTAADWIGVVDPNGVTASGGIGDMVAAAAAWQANLSLAAVLSVTPTSGANPTAGAVEGHALTFRVYDASADAYLPATATIGLGPSVFGEDVTIISTLAAVSAVTPPGDPFIPVIPTGASHSIVIVAATINGTPLTDEDWVAVVDEDGITADGNEGFVEVAAAPWEPNLSLAAVLSVTPTSGADPTPGAVAGHPLKFQIYDASEEAYLATTAVIGVGPSVFAEDFTIVAELQVSVAAAPVITIVTPQSQTPQIAEGATLPFMIEATDPGGESLSFAWLVGTTPQSAAGTSFTLTTNAEVVAHPQTSRSFLVTVRVTNLSNVTASRIWTVTVTDVNRSPTIGSTQLSLAAAGAPTGDGGGIGRNDGIVAAITTNQAGDADAEDSLRFRFRWLVNGAGVRNQLAGDGVVTDTLIAGTFAKGNNVVVEVSAVDFAAGAPLGGESAPVTAAVTIANTKPQAMNDFADVTGTEAVSIPVLLNDVDPDGGTDLNPASIVIRTAPLHGVAMPTASGIDYTVLPGFSGGPDTFTYTVNDLGGATSTEATVTVDVNLGVPWYPAFDLGNASAVAVRIETADGEAVLNCEVTDPTPGVGENVFEPRDYLTGIGPGRSGLLPGLYLARITNWNQEQQRFEDQQADVHVLRVAYDVPPAPEEADMEAARLGDSNRNWALNFFGATFAQGFIVEIYEMESGALFRRIVREFLPATPEESFPTAPASEELVAVPINREGTYRWRLRFFNPLEPDNDTVEATNWSALVELATLTQEMLGPAKKPTLPAPNQRQYFPEPIGVLRMDPETNLAAIDLTWTSAADADGYLVYVASAEGRAVVNRVLVHDTEYRGLALPPGSYHWSVLPVNSELGKAGFAVDWMKPAPQFTVLPPVDGGARKTPGTVVVIGVARNGQGNLVFALQWTGLVAPSVRILVLNPGLLLNPANDLDVSPEQFTTSRLNGLLQPGARTLVKIQGISATGETGPWSGYASITIP